MSTGTEQTLGLARKDLKRYKFVSLYNTAAECSSILSDEKAGKTKAIDSMLKSAHNKTKENVHVKEISKKDVRPVDIDSNSQKPNRKNRTRIFTATRNKKVDDNDKQSVQIKEKLKSEENKPKKHKKIGYIKENKLNIENNKPIPEKLIVKKKQDLKYNTPVNGSQVVVSEVDKTISSILLAPVKNKRKKKARSLKALSETTSGEPQPKLLKGNENNPETLTDLLDDMSVTEKSETVEKVKWVKKKWNKDKKGTINDNFIDSSVVIKGIPYQYWNGYTKLLSQYLGECGQITRIGPPDDLGLPEKKILGATVYFADKESVNKALQYNNSEFCGNIISVQRPLSPTQTTLVVRSYAKLGTDWLKTAFQEYPIKNIRHISKGKNSISTAFVEFRDAESLNLALTKAVDTKINDKKLYVSRYEPRPPRMDAKASGDAKM